MNFRLRLVGADQGPNALGPYRTVEILKPLHLYQEAVLVGRTHKGGEVAEPLRGSELLNAHVMQERMKQPFRVHTTSEIVERLIAREKLDRALSDHFFGSSLAVVASAMSNPFRYFNSSPEIIRLAVLMYVKYPQSLRNVEDLLAERGIDISHETVRFWWNRFGPMFAAEIRNKRVAHMRGYPQWRWHLDQAFVKVNGMLCYLWRAVDHEGEVLEAVVTAKRDKAAALKFLKRIIEEIWPTAERRHRRALLLSRGDERDRQRRSTPKRSETWTCPRRRPSATCSRTSIAKAAASSSAALLLFARPNWLWSANALKNECLSATKAQERGAIQSDAIMLRIFVIGRGGFD